MSQSGLVPIPELFEPHQTPEGERHFLFDYWQASVEFGVEDLKQILAPSESEWKPVRPSNGYRHAINKDGVFGGSTVMQWGMAGEVRPNIRSSGYDAQITRDKLAEKSLLSSCACSRVDAQTLIDDGPGTFERAVELLLPFAKQRGLKTPVNGDWHNPDGEGRTQMLGSPSSAHRLRCYEKWKEMVAKGVPESVLEKLGLTPTTCRLEKQVRARCRADGQRLAMGSADEVFADAWGSDLFQVVCGSFLPKLAPLVIQKPDYDRREQVFFEQNSRFIREVLERLGGEYEAVTDWLIEGTTAELERQIKARRLRKAAYMKKSRYGLV